MLQREREETELTLHEFIWALSIQPRHQDPFVSSASYYYKPNCKIGNKKQPACFEPIISACYPSSSYCQIIYAGYIIYMNRRIETMIIKLS